MARVKSSVDMDRQVIDLLLACSELQLETVMKNAIELFGGQTAKNVMSHLLDIIEEREEII